MCPSKFAAALAVAAVVTLVTGCDGKSPTAPTTPPLTGLVITGADAVLTGLSASYTVTATLADGTSRSVTPTWSSSNPEIATVDGAGQLQGRAHGSATLTASSSGQSVSKTVHVVNNYAGTWTGSFEVKGCNAPPGDCAAKEVDVFSFPIYVAISQTGTDQSDIKATLVIPSWFDGAQANLSGRVSSEGRLILAGSSELTSHGRTWGTFTVGDWDTDLTQGAITGRWAQRLDHLQPAYTEYMENEFLAMKRTSNTVGGMPH
jgi:hypothetical protein